MADTEDQNCYNCRYYKARTEGSGDCVRFPPCIKNDRDQDDRSVGRADMFPTVLSTDWCGEWMGTYKPNVTDPTGEVGEYGGGSSELMEG